MRSARRARAATGLLAAGVLASSSLVAVPPVRSAPAAPTSAAQTATTAGQPAGAAPAAPRLLPAAGPSLGASPLRVAGPAGAAEKTGEPSPSLAAPDPVAPPVEVVVPRAGVRSGLEDLGLLPDGALQPPRDWDTAGWYASGPRPGEVGPAVLAGHVDGPGGPAVFWDLEELRRGDRVEVRRADGSTAVFSVTGRLVAPKDAFPTERVYGPTTGPELRLITCDGGFDAGSGHYLDNLVVFAEQVAVRR